MGMGTGMEAILMAAAAAVAATTSWRLGVYEYCAVCWK
jgi:hypothetical protein